jgi:hypothetical protein
MRERHSSVRRAFVKELGKLETADIARATGADKTSVRAWVRGDRSPSGIYGEPLAELSALVERLAQVLQRDFIRGWLIKPNVALDDGKPLDAIAAGDYRKVSKLISALETTASPELARHAAELGVPPMAMLPRDLWEWEISLTRIADLGDEQRLARPARCTSALRVPQQSRAPGTDPIPPPRSIENPPLVPPGMTT